MNSFLEYVQKISPITNWTGIEKAAGIPPKTMYKHLSGAQPLPAKHIPSIIQALCEVHGIIEIGQYKIRFDSGTFFWQQPVPDREVEIIEVEGGFEYNETQWRGICDAWDIISLFE